jgi:predicted choloylglycine hydrolase
VLLFTDPPDGYASVSMVDITYLGFDGQSAQVIVGLPLEERRGLLDAPLWPFDGMNEQGLAVGMAAVPGGQGPPDPAKGTVDSLGIIRLMLDRARDVDEAVGLLQDYNVEMDGGPDLHYLLADRSGRSALVEFYEGEMVVLHSDQPWHLATNFLRAAAGTSASGRCRRYDRMEQVLTEAGGSLGVAPAMDLLAEVAGETTQWSVVYEMSTGTVHVSMGQQYEAPHTFHLPLVDPQDSARNGP